MHCFLINVIIFFGLAVNVLSAAVPDIEHKEVLLADVLQMYEDENIELESLYKRGNQNFEGKKRFVYKRKDEAIFCAEKYIDRVQAQLKSKAVIPIDAKEHQICNKFNRFQTRATGREFTCANSDTITNELKALVVQNAVQALKGLKVRPISVHQKNVLKSLSNIEKQYLHWFESEISRYANQVI